MSTSSSKAKKTRAHWLALPLLVNLIGTAILWPAAYFFFHLLNENAVMSQVTAIVTSAVITYAIYFFWGFRRLTPNEFMNIERMGGYLRTISGGWFVLCCPGVFDKVSSDGGHGFFSYILDKIRIGDNKDAIDLPGGFTVKASVEFRYRVKPGTKVSVPEKTPAYLWRYAVRDSVGSLKEAVKAFVRAQILAQPDVATLTASLRNIGDCACSDPKVTKALSKMGAELLAGSVIVDIDFDEGTQATRRKKAEGQALAEGEAAAIAGFTNSINLLVAAATANGYNIDYDQAVDTLKTLRLYNVLTQSGGQISPEMLLLFNAQLGMLSGNQPNQGNQPRRQKKKPTTP